MNNETSLENVKQKKKISKQQKIFLIVIISLLIEICICNFPALRTILLGNNNIKAKYTQALDKIYIKDIGVRVTGIKIIYNKELTDGVIYNVKFVAEEENYEKELREKSFFSKNNHYINFDTHSKCEEIEIKLQTGSQKDVKEIIINHPNFNISLLRIGLICGCAFFIEILKNEKLQRRKYFSKSINQQYYIYCVLMILCALIGIYTLEQKVDRRIFVEPKDIKDTDAILLQAEAFMNGNVYLDLEPSQKLLELEDPYDYSERLEQEADFYPDITYYKGKYYSYFGIAPVITLVLPFRILTQKYLQTYIFNLVYVFGSIFLLYEVYRLLIKKYVKKVSLFNFYLGYFAMLIASSLFVALRGDRFDIVITSGIMFLLLSIFLALKLENNKYQKIKLIMLGISTGLIVLSKPTFVVYYPLILFFAWTSLPEKEIKQKIKKSLWSAIPLGMIAIFQMFYNYIRFENIFEFGAQYQLTTFNMKYCMTFTFGKSYLGLADYIFKLPSIDLSRFPFVFFDTRTNGFAMNEVCYRKGVIGLIAIPLLWGFFLKSKNKDKNLKWFTRISLITTVIAIIITTNTGGICEVYSIDFKCLMALNAIILWLKHIENKDKEKNKQFLVICILTIILLVPTNFTTAEQWLSSSARPLTSFLRNIFEFWI